LPGVAQEGRGFRIGQRFRRGDAGAEPRAAGQGFHHSSDGRGGARLPRLTVMSEAGDRSVQTRLADSMERVGRSALSGISEVGLGAVLLFQSLFWIVMGTRRAQPV